MSFNEYAYDIVYLDDGDAYAQCRVCDWETVVQQFTPNLQKYARKHVMNNHINYTEKCAACGHEEVVWS